MKQHDLPGNLLETLTRQANIIHPKTVLIIEFVEDTIRTKFQEATIGKSRSSLVVARADSIHEKDKQHRVISKNGMYKLSFKKNMFDLVVCCGVLEHLKNPEKALAELQRIARKYVILSVPNEPKFRITNMLNGGDILRLGNPSDHLQHWNGETFEVFANKKFSIFTKKEPFPWIVLVGEKI